MKAEEYNLDFTVTLTAEDSKFTDEAVAAGVPLIVVCMFRDALRKLVAAEREACAQIAHNTYEGFGVDAQGVDFVKQQIIRQIKARGQSEIS